MGNAQMCVGVKYGIGMERSWRAKLSPLFGWFHHRPTARTTLSSIDMRRSDLIPKGSKLNEHWEQRLEDMIVGGGVRIGMGLAVCIILFALARWAVS